MQDFIPASDKQVNFMWSLVAEREFASEEFEAEIENEIIDGVSKSRASGLIKYMLGLPRRAAVAPSATNTEPVTETGVYEHNGEVYRVVESKSTGNLYAKKLVNIGPKWKFTYAPGAMAFLKASHRMTEAQAANFGRRTGSCVICARTLTNPDSIAYGLGPVCRTRV